MKVHERIWRVRTVAVCVCLATVAALLGPPNVVGPKALQATEPNEKPAQFRFQAADGKPHGIAIMAKSGGSWIGGHFVPLDEVTKSQLNLKQGLAAHLVVPKSPADKAGMKQYDILLRFNGKEVGDIEGLQKLVEKVADKEVEVVVLRGGSEKKLKVTPEKRPGHYSVLASPVGHPADLAKIFEQLPGGLGRWVDENRVRMLFVKPGVIVPGGIIHVEKFPENLDISVDKHGNRPATITVQSGDKKWKVTEGELDKLPETIRLHVQSMVHGPKQLKIRVLRLEDEESDDEDSASDTNIKGKRRIEVEIDGEHGVLKGAAGLDVELLKRHLGEIAKRRVEVRRVRKQPTRELDKLREELMRLRRDVEMLKKRTGDARNSSKSEVKKSKRTKSSN